MKHYLTWQEKKAIVDEAYICEKNIKANARMHSVSPAQIRRWKAKVAGLFNENGITDGRKRHVMNLKMVQNGRPRKDADKYDELKEYYENIRNMDRVVTVGMLCFELKRLNPTLDIEMRVLRRRVYRWLSSEHVAPICHFQRNAQRSDCS